MVRAATLVSALLATAAAAVATPVAPKEPTGVLNVRISNSTESLDKRDTYGDGTYYNPGLGACGWQSGPDDWIVAVSSQVYDSYPGATANPNLNPICGKYIWLWGWYGADPQRVQIVDRCGGCKPNDIDMTPGLFTRLVGSLGPGRVPIGWNWA